MIKSVALLQALGQRLDRAHDAALSQALAELVHQLVHDLNNPLGTFGLELFSLEIVEQRLRAHAPVEPECERQLEALSSIRTNLQGALVGATQRLAAIAQVARDWAADEATD